MTAVLEKIKKIVDVDAIKIEAGATRLASEYLFEQNYKKVMIVADATTYLAAGEMLQNHLEGIGIGVCVTEIKPNEHGDIIANEASLIQLILDVQLYVPQVLIAVGGGTIHDITRYAAYTTQRPFISYPTAPSVDGFNSIGAPILLRGRKTTIQAVCPRAVFADLEVLMEAPKEMVAAGFSDILGKYTSLFDWKFGHLVAGEPYMKEAAEITSFALQQCVDQVDDIAAMKEEGIHTLMTSLINSGLAMLLFGRSHPASGAEHHLSHYWEEEYIRKGEKQLLHGAKVGVACMEIAKLYHLIAKEGPETWSGIVRKCWEDIYQDILIIPTEENLRHLLLKVGNPTTPEELTLSQELFERSLREAHLVRPKRYTLLRAYNEKF
ncbi:sn-glycerol-1-phosphate dehydrogenase [Bacillaceae bacterium SIJ1]|uniref:sn-glycerol-1-phosphate dehydrogenase n=1 Tax=Litoribacterium kuwaitense TaxID=1398745 RepID=UPI0013EACB73|nr:sn-glycerol-1-phosphate dehydrogenase [Litoribacterium kuwaitense]NGP45258.1 sn-glycerol-1-phosphate dehydrogenase [Litoribacterium kuwaitense]